MAKGNNHFVAGAIIGGLIGGLTVLALSPKTGKEFRQTLNDQFSSLKEKTLQQNDTQPEKECEKIVRKGIPLVQYVKPNHHEEKDSKLDQNIDQMVENLANGSNSSMSIEKILADTEKAFSDVEQKYSK